MDPRIPAKKLALTAPADSPTLSSKRFLAASSWKPLPGNSKTVCWEVLCGDYVGGVSEAVADASDGLNEVGVGFHFFAERPDVDIDGTFEHDAIVSEGDVDEFGARKCSARLSNERGE